MNGAHSELYVISVISNPVRFKSRYELYRKFQARMQQAGIKLITVEQAFGDRPFVVTQPNNHYHIQVRSFEELWHKENMINLGIQALTETHPDWQYVAWIDADVFPAGNVEDWCTETVQQLQHFMVVQMWTNAIDLGPMGETLETHTSFAKQYMDEKPYCYGQNGSYYERWHPGYAWAARREAVDGVGQLIDTAILGAGDNHMAHALVGMMDLSMAKGLHPNYVAHLSRWGERAERFIRRDVGVVGQTILHEWHGKKASRGYHSRWQILVNNEFQPDQDLKRDSYGLWQLVDHGDVRSIKLRDQIRKYFRSRNEDSIDV